MEIGDLGHGSRISYHILWGIYAKILSTSATHDFKKFISVKNRLKRIIKHVIKSFSGLETPNLSGSISLTKNLLICNDDDKWWLCDQYLNLFVQG